MGTAKREIGVEHVADGHATQPGPVDAVVEHIKEAVRAKDDAADERSRASGYLGAEHCHDECCEECFGY